MEERRNKTGLPGNVKERDKLEELEAGGRIT